MVAPIQSTKHYVQYDNAAIAVGAVRANVVSDAIASPAIAVTASVNEGSIVKAFFLEYWLHSEVTAGNVSKFQMVIEKIPNNTVSITFAQMNNIQAYANKKNILFTSQGVLGDLTTASVPIVRQWFLVPKGKQRQGLGDRIVMTVSATAAALDSCGFSTYKEYD